MKKLVTSLSIMGLLATSNISFAAEGDAIKLSSYVGQIPTELNFTTPKSMPRDMAMSVSFGGFGIKDKTEQKEDNVQNKDSYSAFLKIEEEYEKSRLKHAYIFGLFLDFGEGKLSIEDLEVEISNKIKLCRQKEREANVSANKEAKLLAATMIEIWEKFEKVVKTGKKRLLEKNTNMQDIRDLYKEKAIGWFSSRYGTTKQKNK